MPARVNDAQPFNGKRLTETMDETIQELVDRNERTIAAVVEIRDELNQIIRENKRTTLRLKRKLAEEGMIDSDGWNTMDQNERIQFVRDAIFEYNESTEHGAPREHVVEIVSEITDATEESVEEVIHHLRRRGEVYEPKSDFLRST